MKRWIAFALAALLALACCAALAESAPLEDGVYTATFTNSDGDKQATRFSNKGTEKRYFVDPAYYPHAILDTVASQFPKHKITTIYIRDLKGKMTYQARIARNKGFLCWRKETDVKTLSFETNCKMIEVVDEI